MNLYAYTLGRVSKCYALGLSEERTDCRLPLLSHPTLQWLHS